MATTALARITLVLWSFSCVNDLSYLDPNIRIDNLKLSKPVVNTPVRESKSVVDSNKLDNGT